MQNMSPSAEVSAKAKNIILRKIENAARLDLLKMHKMGMTPNIKHQRAISFAALSAK
jgi:hypothetical protein